MNSERLQDVVAQTMRWPFRMWAFGEAIALRGLLAASRVTGDREPFGYVHALLRAYLARGVGRSSEEHVAPGRELLELYGITDDGVFLEAAQKLAALHGSFPAHDSGARYHRADQPGWRHQIWVDCMDVDPPFLAQLGSVTGTAEYFDQAASELVAYCRLLQDSRTGLFYHGFEDTCGHNGQLWARGNGWALLGLVETLKFLPDTHESRLELLDVLQRLCAALANFQDVTGLWHTVIPSVETYLESTLAAMVACGLHEAFPSKLLQSEMFSEMERKARVAVLSRIKADGSLGLVTDATPIGEFATYASRSFGTFPWGQGPLLLLLSQS